MSTLLEARDLFHVYRSPDGGVAALQGLTLSVFEGETCVVLGPSGSGKSTLLRLVAGFDRPSAGELTVAGLDVATLSPRDRARYRAEVLGYADQHYWRALAGELSVEELVGVHLGLAGAPADVRRRRAVELLERVGLADRREARPHELSGGEQQRVALCAAVAHRPRLLIADEPTGELDAASAREVFALIAELVREGGGTALVVSHDPASAAYADRVVHVRDGRVSSERRVDADDEAVVGRGGWLRVPAELLGAAGIAERATLSLRGNELVVAAPGGDGLRDPGTQTPPEAAPRPEAKGDCVPGTQALVEARGLVRAFGDATPLDGLDASFAAGQLVAVTGPSGSGKTTLLHLLAGLDLPDAGTIVVDGIDLDTLDRAGRAELRRTRIAFIGQTPGLVPFLGARENATLALAIRGVPADDAAERADEALAAVGLEEHADRPVELLSAGQRERAAVARAIAMRPLVVLADEPTARLDAANAAAIGVLFADLAHTTGAAFVCATHDQLLIEQADQELRLGSG